MHRKNRLVVPLGLRFHILLSDRRGVDVKIGAIGHEGGVGR